MGARALRARADSHRVADVSESQIHRDIGRLEGQVRALESQVADMKVKIDVMHEAITSAKGGWKTLLWVGGAAASLGALVTKIVGVVFNR